MKVCLGMLLTVSLIVVVGASILMSITDSWAANYLVVVISGAVVVTSTVGLMILAHYDDWNRQIENADTANTEFRD